jgi:ABC-type Mn2+/Zn2+ transport system ATPase subunit
MKNIYIIIGEGKCGKSSLVRALTGVFRRSKKSTRIAQTNTDEIMHINVWPQSAQEARKNPEKVLREIKEAWSNNVLLVLRFLPHNNTPFSATDYVELIQEHHNIVQVIFMGPGDKVSKIQTPGIQKTLKNTFKNPVNQNASEVRGWWGWY